MTATAEAAATPAVRAPAGTRADDEDAPSTPFFDRPLTSLHLVLASTGLLLAPAAASMDMFHDYAARGDAFAAAVRAMEGS